MSAARVIVVGGGLAGITAALTAADGGAPVTLVERRRHLGGLTWSSRRNGIWFDNGQHVFLRCCEAYLGLLGRLGVADLVHLQDRLAIPVLAPGRAEPAWIRRSRLPAPLHLAGSLAAYRLLSPGERLGLVGAALALARLDPDDPALDGRTFGAWLAEHGQRDRAVERLWNLIIRPTVNLPAGEASLALAVKVFRTGLLDRAGAGDIGWATVPLARLHGESSERALAEAGVEVVTGASVEAVDGFGDGRAGSVRVGPRTVGGGAVVLATPPGVAAALLPAGLGPDAAALGTSAVVNVHLVLDRRVTDLTLAAAVDSPIEFLFDRTESSGLERGQYLAVSLSAADRLLGRPSGELVATHFAALGELLPAARRARLLDAVVTREPAATFRGGPGSRAYRPGTAAARPGVFLAGAWTDTGWPATMESAVRSGRAAGRAALARVGGAGHPDGPAGAPGGRPPSEQRSTPPSLRARSNA